MYRVFAMCLEAGIAAIILIPVFWVLNRYCFRNSRRAVWYLLMSLYLAAVDAVVGLPSLMYIRFDQNINLVPFAYMFSDYRNSLLNVLLFVPLGFFLPVLWKRFRPFLWTALFGLGFSLSIELLQLFTFRATDINDLMTNTAGTILGWCLGRLIGKLFPSIRPSWKTGELAIVFGATFAVMFLAQPFLAEIVWKLVKI